MLSPRMSLARILLLALFMTPHAMDFYKPLFVSVKSGERVTLNCSFLESSRSDYIIWYRQRFGEIPQDIGERLLHTDAKPSPQRNSSGVKMDRIINGISMTIKHAKKDDAGLYFCGLSNWEKATFFNGTYLTVTGDEDVKVSVFQSSVSDSVPAGASVTLQCSVLSESRAAELQVLWFRAAPSQSHPQLIYTHHNSSLQCEDESSTHTCVYNLSKNIFSLNDTGTYYCAVALCGKIIFGNGTRVQLEDDLVDPLVIALGVCVVVIFFQAVFNCKRRNSECSMRHQHGSNKEKVPNQSEDAVDLNYAALHFNKKKTKRMRRTKADDCVYSEVIMSPAP
ncbi:uncharacterized protein LOC124386137 [Silurus meridionalis]|uniref:Ig-like domain-containing protein n=1 Tax=Silurus meridionalis TaxID=175797 RepID=A0A8T0BNI9_SILME|nr:uncharacterized protein LOC124386137 [Silurus meridionalis]KAF7706976.1 hypothetical protein HF521_018194 [Silurus meridionalis]